MPIGISALRGRRIAPVDRQELDFLATMTRDRGPVMERMRKQYLVASDSLSSAERNRILQITSLFERAAWALNRFGSLLQDAPGLGVEMAQDADPGASHSRQPSGQPSAAAGC